MLKFASKLTSIRKQDLTGLLLLLLLMWMLSSHMLNAFWNPLSTIKGGDFKFFHSAAARLNAGEPLYVFEATGATYVYPPLLAILMRPLGAMEHDAALTPWLLINAGVLGASAVMMAFAAGMRLRHAIPIAVMIIIGFRFWPTVMTFGLAQTNFLLLFCFAGMIWATTSRRPWMFVVFLILAASIKTWMIGCLLYLLLTRRWAWAGIACVGYAVFIAFLFWIVGFNEFAGFYELTRGYASQKLGLMVVSQSIPGFAMLHFTENQHVAPLIESRFLQLLTIGFGVAITGTLFWAFWQWGPSRSSYETRLRLSVLMIALLLLLPYGHPEYNVLCLPLIWVMLAPSRGEWKLISLPLMFLCFIGYVAFTRGGPYYPPLAEHLKAGGLASLRVSQQTFCELFLLGVGFAATWVARRRSPATDRPEPAPLATPQQLDPAPISPALTAKVSGEAV